MNTPTQHSSDFSFEDSLSGRADQANEEAPVMPDESAAERVSTTEKVSANVRAALDGERSQLGDTTPSGKENQKPDDEAYKSKSDMARVVDFENLDNMVKTCGQRRERRMEPAV